MSPTVRTVYRSECEALPKGWIREEVPRVGGNSKASDVYYISPMGKRISSKVQLVRMIGDVYDLKAFDYFSGKINLALVRPRPASRRATGERRRRSTAASNFDFTKNLMHDLPGPTRQTANIFRKPVTVLKPNHDNDSGRREDLDAVALEKPRQLFWEKRLVGLQPSFEDDNFRPLCMSNIFKAVEQDVRKMETEKTPKTEQMTSTQGSSTSSLTLISNETKI